jgi:hypothetical protein
MNKFAVILIMVLAMTGTAMAADYVLTITIPDAWVTDTANAFNSKVYGRVEAGKTKAEWVKIQIISWIKNDVVIPYRNRVAMEAIVEQYYTATDSADIAIK